VSAEASIELIAENGLRESLAEICASGQDSHRFVAGVFDELDALCNELLREQQAWLADREQTESDLQERAAQLEADCTALESRRQQMAEKEGRQRAQPAGEEAESSGQLERLLEEANQERAALRSALEGAQAQADRLAQMADKVSGASSGLAEAREEIHRLRDQLEKAPAQNAQPQPDGELLGQLQQMEQDRLVLETELETVRNRAAEMAETLAEQRRQSAEERKQWTQELKRMRRMLEMLSAHRFEHQAAPGPEPARGESRDPAGPSPEAAAAPAPHGDPVLDSVMAQFEMLQKDLARRRKATATRN
jgi:chromosome segregation ATPase